MLDKTFDECFCGSVTVGERGQIVIPADVRKQLDISAGDRLLVFRHPMGHGLLLSRLNTIQEVLQALRSALEVLESEAAKCLPSEEKEEQ